eukprot:3465242-Amphidinium_carterae.2
MKGFLSLTSQRLHPQSSALWAAFPQLAPWQINELLSNSELSTWSHMLQCKVASQATDGAEPALYECTMCTGSLRSAHVLCLVVP